MARARSASLLASVSPSHGWVLQRFEAFTHQRDEEEAVTEPNVDIVIDCANPETLADFWAEALGYTKAGLFDSYFVLLSPVRELPPVILQRVPEPKTAKARIHFDLRVADIETEARRLEGLGARRIDIGQGPDPGWITMADPEGNEFCVCPGVPLSWGNG